MGDEAERAETYLRLLAEAALRHATYPKDPGPLDADADRARRAADTLVDAGVLTEEHASDILLMFQMALRVRGRREFLPGGSVRRLAGLTARPASAAFAATPPPGAAEAQSPEPPTAGQAWRVIPAASSQGSGSRLMALIVTAERMIAPATLRFPPSAGLEVLEGPSFADLTATDDVGTQYMLTFTDGAWAGHSWTGTIQLRPPPPPGARLLTINGPNGPALSIPFSSPPARPAPATADATDSSPGERLLIRRAESLLGRLNGTTGAPGSHWQPFGPPPGLSPMAARRAAVSDVLQGLSAGLPLVAAPAAGRQPVAYAGVRGPEPTLAELVETLEGAGLLSPLSPVPAQVAALADGLGLRDHAAREGGWPAQHSIVKLPARWASVLAYYGRRHPPPRASGTGSIGAVLPEVDGASFVLAGARTGQQGTLLHVVGRGPRPALRPASDLRFSWWARDDFGTWHLGVVQDWHMSDDELRLRLAVLPPLNPGEPGSASRLTLELTGPRHRAIVELKVHW